MEGPGTSDPQPVARSPPRAAASHNLLRLNCLSGLLENWSVYMHYIGRGEVLRGIALQNRVMIALSRRREGRAVGEQGGRSLPRPRNLSRLPGLALTSRAEAAAMIDK
jgi:hypothetical protein